MTKKSKGTSLGNVSIRSMAVDTSAIVATLSSIDKYHRTFMSFWGTVNKSSVEFVTSEACLSEVHYLLPGQKKYRELLQVFLHELAVKIVPLELIELVRIHELMDKYEDLPMDFADATLVVACEQRNISHVLTTDSRDFSIYRPKHCKRFEILPGR